MNASTGAPTGLTTAHPAQLSINARTPAWSSSGIAPRASPTTIDDSAAEVASSMPAVSAVDPFEFTGTRKPSAPGNCVATIEPTITTISAGSGTWRKGAQRGRGRRAAC